MSRAAAAYRRWRAVGFGRRGIALPLVALLCILVFLSPAGPAARVDVMAHVWGLVCGMVLGLSYPHLAPYRMRYRLQLCALTAAAAIVLVAWALALG